MRITGSWLHHAGTQQVLAVLGPGAYGVGGCVRNDLLGLPVADIDIATDLPPVDVVARAEAAGLRVIPTGLDHGTVTVIAGGLPHEVTTFRRDIETDGRHAVVRFSTQMVDDARRRDFTINALYCDPAGDVLDPLGGLEDLRARRVRFIDDAAQRIAEDRLRILRFFRFTAWYGDPAQGVDAKGLAACAAGLSGLAQLSGERITGELIKLLCAPDPGPAVAAMAQAGVLNAVLPGAEARLLPVLVHLETVPPDPLARLAILGGETGALRVSRAEARRLERYRAALGDGRRVAEWAQEFGADTARHMATLRAAQFEEPLPQTLELDLARGATAQFPVAAQDLQPRFQGAALGAELRRLRALWIASDFTATREDLLK